LVSGEAPAQQQCSTSEGRKAAAAPQCISGRTSYLHVRLAFHLHPQLIRAVCNPHRCGPPRPVRDASAWPWIAHVVSRLRYATNALFRLAFTAAPAVAALTEPRTVTRRIILQKARCHPTSKLVSGSNGMQAHDFRFYFTPLAGVLFTVPSRYCALSVAACSLPWTVVSPASDQVLRARPYSGNIPGSMPSAYTTLTCYGAAFQTASATRGGPCGARQRALNTPTTPRRQRLAP
jgi:hypothetical protein